MTHSRDPRIDAYIAKSAEFAQPILQHLRELVHQACPEATETIKWNMPHFEYAGAILCNMAAFKAHCAFGFWHQGMRAVLRQDGIDGESAMGSFGRITSLKDLPGDKTMLRYVGEAAKLNASGAPARLPSMRSPAKEPRVPADLAAVLKKNKAAAKNWTDFSPSHRREYIEWITEAKREETRQTRIATTLQWLSAGKARNWKYMNR